MKNFAYKLLTVIIITTLLEGCMKADNTDGNRPSESQINDSTKIKKLSEHVQNIENLTVYSLDKQVPDTIELVKEQVFESTENILIKGYISKVAVDKKDRVIILGFRPGDVAFYVFDSDGKFLKTFGGSGRGPGEFITVSSMYIKDNNFYALDRIQHKLVVFSLEDFKLLYEKIIDQDSIKNNDVLAKLIPVQGIPIGEDGAILLKFKSNVNSNEDREILYYKMDKDGNLLPERILELKRHYIYETGMKKTSSGVLIPFVMPFTRSSLLTLSNNGQIYTAWSEDFLIKVYDRKGNYTRAFYYTYPKTTLSLPNMEISENQLNILKSTNLPTTWPALHTMFFDDQNRLWVSTFTDSDSTYQWWVLDMQGKLLARFVWPGKRSLSFPGISPKITIKNGYLYNRKSDEQTGLQQVVKYKINFKKR